MGKAIRETHNKCIPSPTILPSEAPILKTGIKIPDGTGMVDVIIEKKNCKNKIDLGVSRGTKHKIVKYLLYKADTGLS